MIPKRAIFYWEGGGIDSSMRMPWLRRMSIQTFQNLNPSWEVVEISGPLPRPNRMSDLHIAHRSDMARYEELALRGGFYFDTDIMFARPIPDSWLDHELVLPLGADGQLGHIAAMGAEKYSPFFRQATIMCRELQAKNTLLNYQGYGKDLLKRALNSISSTRILWTEHERFIPVPHWDVAQIWNPWAGPFPALTIGVHWFGGDPLSRAIEHGSIDPSFQRSLAGKAYAMAVKDSDSEVLSEQHGLA